MLHSFPVSTGVQDQYLIETSAYPIPNQEFLIGMDGTDSGEFKTRHIFALGLDYPAIKCTILNKHFDYSFFNWQLTAIPF